MAFDWEQFLTANNIEWTRDRRYASTGVISIACPFCGDDPSFHMGISTRRNLGWHCWREPVAGAHSGRSPHRLIQQILGCTFEFAASLVRSGERYIAINDDSFLNSIDRMLGGEQHQEPPPPKLHFLPEFNKFTSARAVMMFYPYLVDRGYSIKQIEWMAERFDLHCVLGGPFTYRVIIPVYFDNELVTWTGRTIAKGEDLRYKTLSHKAENAAKSGLPVAPMNIKDCLFDFDDALLGGDTLVIVEGPFDAIRVTTLGERHGIRAVACFGKAISDSQQELLWHLIPRYKRTVSLFDIDTSLFLLLPGDTVIKQLRLPTGVKDPGVLSVHEFWQVFD